MDEEAGVILLVEDNLADWNWIQRGFTMLGLSAPLLLARNGQEAVRHLQQGLAPRPDLLILDLNMPLTDDFFTLGEVRHNPKGGAFQ